MKKIILLLIMFTFIFIGCSSKEQVFAKEGLSITLTSDFEEMQYDNWDLYLQSDSITFMSSRASKDSNIGELQFSNLSLKEYFNYSLAINKLETPTYHVDGIHEYFEYCYYSTTVNGEPTYAYMFIGLEGKDHFYTVNLCCDYDQLENFKPIFFKYALSIKVD